MKSPLAHLAWIGLLFCGVAFGQTTYTIKPGDSLAKIARKHGCTTEELAKANGLKLTAIIHPGQKLSIPGKAVRNPAGGRAAATPAAGTHTIQQGDTFAAISRLYGIPVDKLLAANPGVDPKSLRPGQKVQLTGATAAARPAPASSTAASVPAAAASADVPADLPQEEETTAPPTATEGRVITVAVDSETTFGDFAAKHGTDVARLNELNGLQLDSATVLAKGSELYVPARP